MNLPVSLVIFSPSPYSSGAGAMAHVVERGAQPHSRAGLHTDGKCPHPPLSPSSLGHPPFSPGAALPHAALLTAAHSQLHTTGAQQGGSRMAARSAAMIFRCLIVIVLGSEQETHAKPTAQYTSAHSWFNNFRPGQRILPEDYGLPSLQARIKH